MVTEFKNEPGMIIARILTWAGIIVYIIWLIAKMTGLINTLLWITYLPHMATTVAVLGISHQSGKIVEKVSRIEILEQKVDRNNERIIRLEHKVDSNTTSIEKLNKAVF